MSSTLRCLKALEFMAEPPFELSVSDVAQRLSIAMSSAHRLLATVRDAGFVDQDPVSSRYRLSARALWVGAGFLRHSSVYHAAYLEMQELAKKVEGMLALGVWESDRIVILYTEGMRRPTEILLDIGSRHPVYATALGKAMLAFRPASDARRIMANGCHGFTEKTILTYAAMSRELLRVRRRGYATNNEEFILGVRAIAAPVRDHRGEVRAAISLADTVTTLTAKQVERYASLLLETTLRTSMRLGFRPGSVPLAGHSTDRGQR